MRGGGARGEDRETRSTLSKSEQNSAMDNAIDNGMKTFGVS